MGQVGGMVSVGPCPAETLTRGLTTRSSTR